LRNDYWVTVQARIAANNEAIRINKARRAIAGALMPPPGSPPFAYRPVYEALSALEPRDDERARRDYRAWRRERYGGFAAGIYHSEMADARRKAFTRSIHRTPVANDAYAREMTSGAAYSDDKDNGCAVSFGPWRQGPLPISHDEWRAHGYHIESIPAGLIPPRKDRELAARILAKSPGRPVGRPPLNGRAMTGAERVARYRAKNNSARRPTSVLGPTLSPMPLGLAAPGHPLTKTEPP
jgi:hypothetical protein